MNEDNKLLRFCCTAVSVLMILLTGYLFLLSIFGTSMINVLIGYESTDFLTDSPLLHLGAIILVLLVGYMAVPRLKSLSKKTTKYLFAGIGLAFFIIGTISIVRLSLIPTTAQYWSLDAASRLISGDYSFWERSGFCYIYPWLNSLILFLVPFVAIFGLEGGAIAFQIFNLLMILLALYALYGFCKETGLNAAFSSLLFLFFLPFTFYIFFVYGNVVSSSLSVCAMWTAARYLNKGRRRDALISAVVVNIAILFKDMALITLIALCIIIVLYMVSRRQKKMLSWLFLCLLLYILCPLIVNAVIKNVTSQEVPSGTDVFGHVLMGISEGSRAEGWYNNYTFDMLVACDFDYDAYHAAAKRDFLERFAAFRSDPAYVSRFFSRKTASQWNNPTFQSVWIVQQMLNASNRQNTGLFLDGSSVNMTFFFFCNLYQSLILFGTLSFFVLKGTGSSKKLSLPSLIPAVTFLGGFIFLFFWEAKAQYTLLFFVLLIPYAAEGIAALLREFRSIASDRNAWQNSKAVIYLALLLIVTLVTSFLRQPGSTFSADGDAEYEYYLEENIH